MAQKKRVGRPAAEFNDQQREQVRALAGYGLTHDQIAVVTRIPLGTLEKHFKRELSEGVQVANAAAIQYLFQNVKAGNVAAQIFWAKVRCGWREVNSHEFSGPNGKPIPIEDTNRQVIASLTKAELLALIQATDPK